MTTAAQHAAAVIAALNVQLAAAGATAYDIDALRKMTATPKNYVEVTVSRRFGSEPRSVARYSATGWRVTTRWVSATSIANARNLEARGHAALEGAVLAVDGRTSTPVQFETAEPIADDEGWWSGLTAWTYVL